MSPYKIKKTLLQQRYYKTSEIRSDHSEKREGCVCLGEEHCFYTNQSGIVKENAWQLLFPAKGQGKENESYWKVPGILGVSGWPL